MNQQSTSTAPAPQSAPPLRYFTLGELLAATPSPSGTR